MVWEGIKRTMTLLPKLYILWGGDEVSEGDQLYGNKCKVTICW